MAILSVSIQKRIHRAEALREQSEGFLYSGLRELRVSAVM